MIDRLPCKDIKPLWMVKPANRYESHPALRTAAIQCLDDPGAVYIVYDQKLPVSIPDALAMIVQWRKR